MSCLAPGSLSSTLKTTCCRYQPFGNPAAAGKNGKYLNCSRFPHRSGLRCCQNVRSLSGHFLYASSLPRFRKRTPSRRLFAYKRAYLRLWPTATFLQVRARRKFKLFSLPGRSKVCFAPVSLSKNSSAVYYILIVHKLLWRKGRVMSSWSNCILFL